MAKTKGLGKGLEALFTENNYFTENETAVNTVRISNIEPDKEQPRKIFNEESLTVLSESIERHGVLQPLVVRKAKTSGNESAASKLFDDKYIIVSGERRWRAAKMAGLTEVPVVVKELSDTDVAAIMLVENLQREDLNPVELAEGLKRLIDEFGLTHEQTAEIVGISRPALTNSLRLLSLPDEVLDTLSCGDITAGHARALLALQNTDLILTALQSVVSKGLSVRETEKLVKDMQKPAAVIEYQDDTTLKNKREMKVYISKLEEKITSNLGRKTAITLNKKKPGCGKLEIEYYDNSDLETLIKQLCGTNFFNED